MKIVVVAVRNFLGIRDFKAKLGPGVNMVRGANGSGKSSFIKGVIKALRGGISDAPWTIHRLEGGGVAAGPEEHPASAEILVELEGDVKVMRRIAEGDSELVVTERQGVATDVAKRSPKAYLDSLLGRHSLNPIDLFKETPAEQRKILLQCVPSALSRGEVEAIIRKHDIGHFFTNFSSIGLNELRLIEKELMEQRKMANNKREYHEECAKAAFDKLPPNYQFEEVPSVGALVTKLDEANATVEAIARQNELVARKHSEVDRAAQSVDAAKKALDAKRAELAEAERLYDSAENRVRNAVEDWEDAKGDLAIVEGNKVDPDPIRAELKVIKERQIWSAAWEEARGHEEDREVQAVLVRCLDNAIQQGIRVEAAKLLWSKLDTTPLKGLDVGMDGDRITVGGVDVANLSQSEQIRFALAVARAAAGEIKVICVDGFEALDKDTRAEFARQASEDGFQYIVGEVAEGALRVEQG